MNRQRKQTICRTVDENRLESWWPAAGCHQRIRRDGQRRVGGVGVEDVSVDVKHADEIPQRSSRFEISDVVLAARVLKLTMRNIQPLSKVIGVACERVVDLLIQ